MGGLNCTVNKEPLFLNFKPFLLKARQKPFITIGTTTGFVIFMIYAVPFLPGAKAFVVPCGKVITQLFSSARVIFLVSDGSSPLRTSVASVRQVRFTVRAPANIKRRLNKLPFIVSSAAT